MKKSAIIGIITGAVVLNIAAFSLFGSYLSSAKSASTEIRTHNDGVAVSENVYYDLGSNNKGVTADMDFAAEAEFADEVKLLNSIIFCILNKKDYLKDLEELIKAFWSIANRKNV